jgi:muramoyltetrapeptide carboxypeptidase
MANVTPSAKLAPLKAVAPGAKIAVVGLASAAAPEDAPTVASIAPWLAQMGFSAVVGPSCHAGAGVLGLAGDDALRLSELHGAFADPTIAAVLCLRGGYGSGRLLDRIRYDLIRAHPKPFIGFSDITALHIAFNQRAGLITFHGPMAIAHLVAGMKDPTVPMMLGMIAGQYGEGAELPSAPDTPLTALAPGVARGRLVGGNLSMVAASLGTPYEIDTTSAILFLEEVGEEAYRVDRMLNQLRLSGKLAQAAGVLVGQFLPPDGSPLSDQTQVLADALGPLGIPVLSGFPAGHDASVNLTLPLGAVVRLDADRKVVVLEQAIVAAAPPTA